MGVPARRSVVMLAAIAAAAGCRHEPGPARVKRIPTPYGSPALRGGGPARSPRIANYKIDARLDAARHQIEASEVLTWTNAGTTPVDRLPFHLYLNAFKNEQSLFMQSSRGVVRTAHASDNGWGWIEVTSLQIGGVELASSLVFPHTPDQSVAELPLAQPVQPGQTIQIAMRFTDQLPEVFARTGYKGDFNMVGQWFPKIGVRVGPPGAERWECEPLTVNTEFFADFGTYDVSLTVPDTEVVAATGVLVAAAESPGGMRTLRYHAEDVHDFAWMADPYMSVFSGQAKLDDGTVEVRVYARPEQAEFARRHLQAAIGAIQRFSADFVPYPWPLLTVIDPPLDAAAGAGGMEYPTLVTTAGDTVFARPGLRLPEYVTVHEVGHNWFQGMLASDEANEAWLDEGVDEWADARVMDDLYGARTSGVDWMGWQAEIAALRRAATGSPPDPTPIATAAYDFVDPGAYAEASYDGTMRAFETLEGLVGTTALWNAMRTYAKTWAFRHPTGADLFASLNQSLGQDLSWFWKPVFEEVGGARYRVRTATCAPAHKARGVFGDGSAKKTVTESDAPDGGTWSCEVVVENTGVVHVPIDVELRFADGTSERVRWDDRGSGPAWHRFELQRSAELEEVRLDPDGKIALGSPVTRDRRLTGDGAASLRAAARIASWTQTLMQLVGP